jgi:hypothetical protein
METTDPNILISLFGFAQSLLAPLLAAGVSVIYFFNSPRTQPIGHRIAASAHGLSISAIYFLAMTVFWANKAQPMYGGPFILLLLLPILLAILSFFLYKGRKTVHLLQVVNLLCLAWTFFIGGMAVTGQWL